MADPWAEFNPVDAEASADPWAEFKPSAPKTAPATTSVAGDVARGLGHGLVSGVTALPRKIREDVRGIIEGTPPPKPPPPPQRSRPERIAESVGEAVGNPESYIGPGGIIRKIIGAGAAGAGSETAGELAHAYAPSVETPARIAGGMLGQAAAAPRGPRLPAAPTREELAVASGQDYEQLRNMNVTLPRHGVERLADTIVAELRNDGFYQQPATYSALRRLSNPVGASPNATEVYSVREELNHVVRDHPHGFPNASDGAAAARAIERIDEYLDNLPGFGDTAQRARGNYRAGMQSERLTEAQRRGELNAASSGSGANLDNATRQRIKALLLNQKIAKTPQEAEMMEAIVRGDTPTNIARLLSKLGPQHPLSGWGSILAGFATGHIGLAEAGMATGAIAQHFAERATARGVERLDETIRRNSPLGGGPLPPQGVPPWVIAAGRGALAPGAGSALAQPGGP
jgi:hypothetical protein